MLLNFVKYCLGYMLGDFLTKASGHPVLEVPGYVPTLATQ
jgi:hypothetical protein